MWARYGNSIPGGLAIRVLSLCSGIGGLELAVSAVLGGELVAYSEIEKDAITVIEHHWPGTPNLGDIKQIEWFGLEDHGIHMITAGYPCQPFSLAGKREGEDDPRHLWPHIFDGIRILRPRLVLLENVGGHRSKGLGEVVKDLAQEGYSVCWTTLRAADVGAPHSRERVFILAADPDGGEVWIESFRQSQRIEASFTPGYDQVASYAAGIGLPPRASKSLGNVPQFTVRGERDSGFVDWEGFGPAIERWEIVLGRPHPSPLARGERGGLAISPEFSEWFMGYPEGWISFIPGLSNRDGMRLCGNAVVPLQGALALRELLETTLTYGLVREAAYGQDYVSQKPS